MSNPQSDGSNESAPRKQFASSPLLPLILLLVATILVFVQIPSFPFVLFDDNIQIYNNPHFSHHTLSDIGYFWTHSYEQLYIPMSYTLFGLLIAFGRSTNATIDPHAFHAASLVLHVANVTLVFFLLRRLTKENLGAAFGALVFAIHPLQVESVAWASELRGLLGATFSLGSFHLFLNFARRPAAKSSLIPSYTLSVMLAVCAMLSKPTYVVDGFIIAALGVWACQRSWKQAVFDTAPFLAVGLVLVAVTTNVQSAPRGEVGVWLRPFIAGDTITFYLAKLIYPLDLAIDYGRKPNLVMTHWWAYLEWLVPIALGVVAWKFRKSAPSLAFGLVISLAALLPVLGFTPFLFQEKSTVADRYMYLPMLGIAIIAAFWIAGLPIAKKKFIILAPVIGLIWAAISFTQTHVWASSYALLTHAVAVNPNSAAAQNNLGNLVSAKEDFSRAMECYTRAANSEPTFMLYRNNVGVAESQLGDYANAEVQFRRAIALAPNDPLPHYDLGSLLLSEKRNAEGIAEMQTVLRLNPAVFFPAAYDIGEFEIQQKNNAAAIATFTQELSLRPDVPKLWRGLGMAYIANGQPTQAKAALQTTLKLNPNDKLAASELHVISTK
jgi:tetratricopeptide (TPR) repeat protein